MAPGLASPVICRSEKTRWCVRPSTLQLVMQSALDESAQRRFVSLVAVEREAGDVGLATHVRHRAVHGLDDVALNRPGFAGGSNS